MCEMLAQPLSLAHPGETQRFGSRPQAVSPKKQIKKTTEPRFPKKQELSTGRLRKKTERKFQPADDCSRASPSEARKSPLEPG